jgi:hypothetical protein
MHHKNNAAKCCLIHNVIVAPKNARTVFEKTLKKFPQIKPKATN